MLFITVVSAFVLDQIFGEPKRYHPLVGFGNTAIYVEKKLNRAPKNAISILIGSLALMVLVTIPVFISAALFNWLGQYAIALNVIALYWAIGLKSLLDHTKPISDALAEKNTKHARISVGHIVSRNTEAMSESQITSATIESTLENGCDGIFGAIFWCLIGGAPCVIAYRLINTLDAMWGYRTPQFEYFGKSSAILDDVLNYIPARLTALSYAVLGQFNLAMECWKNQAAKLSSPNAGPVMCAGAGSLNIRLGGPSVYHNRLLNKPYFGGNQAPAAEDIQRANQLVIKSALLWCVAVLLLSLILMFL